VKKQQCEIEKAVIGYGEYRLRPQYSSLAVSEDKWFKMSEERVQCIKKFNTSTLRSGTKNFVVSAPINISQPEEQHDITIGRFSIEEGAGTILSVDLNDFIKGTKLPHTSAEGVWKEAGMLIAEEGAIVSAPGFGSSDRMVKSRSGAIPHLVTDKGPRWASIQM